MTTESRDPFETIGAVLGYCIAVVALVPIVYAMLPIALPWLFRKAKSTCYNLN
jgi:hypothetical protein